MEADLQKQIENRLHELPQDVQQAILSSELDVRLQKIGKKHELHIDQIGTLEDETMLVMLGFIDPASFVGHLQTQVRLTPEKATLVAADVSNEVFMPIRESMKQFFATKTPPPSAPPAHTAPLEQKEPHPAEMALNQKTVSMPTPTVPQKPAAPLNPSDYKTDPYREPFA